MIPYRLDYTIEKILKDQDFNAQRRLKTLTGKSLNRKEAENVWLAIQNHKWLVSRRLGRDIGFRVAAVDYLENFYKSETFYSSFLKKVLQPRSSVI